MFAYFNIIHCVFGMKERERMRERMRENERERERERERYI
jgi:hypothetical protein